LPADIQKKWLEFCFEKLKSLKDRNVYEVVNLSIVQDHWVFNIKFNGHYRSQLIAKGFSQVEEIDFDKLFSLVVHYETTHLFLAIATLEDWDIHSIYVKTANLYSNLDEKIYIEQLEDFRLSSKEKKVQ